MAVDLSALPARSTLSARLKTVSAKFSQYSASSSGVPSCRHYSTGGQPAPDPQPTLGACVSGHSRRRREPPRRGCCRWRRAGCDLRGKPAPCASSRATAAALSAMHLPAGCPPPASGAHLHHLLVMLQRLHDGGQHPGDFRGPLCFGDRQTLPAARRARQCWWMQLQLAVGKSGLRDAGPAPRPQPTHLLQRKHASVIGHLWLHPLHLLGALRQGEAAETSRQAGSDVR